MLQIKDPNDDGAPADAGATEGEDLRGKGGPDAALLVKMAAAKASPGALQEMKKQCMVPSVIIDSALISICE